MFDTADEHLRVKNPRAAFWTDRDIVPKHKSWHTTQRMWCAEKWTRLSKWTLLLCVVGEKKVCTVPILRPSRRMCSSFHVYMCVFCVWQATQSRWVRRRRTRRRLLLPGDYCAVSRSLWHQLLLSGAWLMLRCKAPLISLDEKGLDWEGMEQGAELCQQSPSLPICLILFLTNHTVPFCQSLLPAQSLDW